MFCLARQHRELISLIYINQGNILGCTKHVYSTLLPNSYLHHTPGSLVRPRSDHILTIKELWSLFRTGQRPPPKSFIVAVLIWTLVQLEFNLTKYQYYSCDITRLWGKSCHQTTGIFKFKHGSGFLFKWFPVLFCTPWSLMFLSLLDFLPFQLFALSSPVSPVSNFSYPFLVSQFVFSVYI